MDQATARFTLQRRTGDAGRAGYARSRAAQSRSPAHRQLGNRRHLRINGPEVNYHLDLELLERLACAAWTSAHVAAGTSRTVRKLVQQPFVVDIANLAQNDPDAAGDALGQLVRSSVRKRSICVGNSLANRTSRS